MKYYTYAYLREDGTPYYIGKGSGNRAYLQLNHMVKTPERERVLILKQNLTEEEANQHEVYMINLLGRKDIGTGTLRNETDGGEGVSGYTHSEETKRLLAEQQLGKPKPRWAVEKQQATRKRNNKQIGGWTLSQDWKDNMSKIMSGKKDKRVTCPHCNKEGGVSGMKRYHFDNCKHQVCVLPNFS